MILLIEFFRGYGRAADERDAATEAIRDGKTQQNGSPYRDGTAWFERAYQLLEILDGHRKAAGAFGLGARAAVSADELEDLRRALARAESTIPIHGPGGSRIDPLAFEGSA